MRALQFYYTSCVQTTAGTSGFQMKAMSPGILPDLQSLLARLSAYRIPPTLDATHTDKHPIALRYHYQNEQECILLCSQSSGPDELGRPGNFFAHGLVLEHDIFSCVPPIFFWKSPFWQKQDAQERSQIVSLPVLNAFDEEPTLELEDIWRFLARDNRRDLLHKLLCAVLSSGITQRRIVIIDEVEHVVMWIAAVSCLLPPAYRPLLTFATFHHDPYQSLSLVTGTTGVPFFRATREEYQSFFVLNALTDTVSDVLPSAYADLAIAFAESGLYETKLLRLFSDYTRHFPYTPVFDGQLDHLAHYSRIVLGQSVGPLTPQERGCLQIALSSFENQPTFTQEDTDELSNIATALRERRRAEHTPRIEGEYLHVIALLQSTPAALDTLVLEELLFAIDHMMTSEQTDYNIPPMQELYEVYGEARVLAVLNSMPYLLRLFEHMENARCDQLSTLWKMLGAHIQPATHSLDMVLISLQKLVQLWKQQSSNEIYSLLQEMFSAANGYSQQWLQLLHQLDDHVPFEIFSCLCQEVECSPSSIEEHVDQGM
jgi:hypothetical protein